MNRIRRICLSIALVCLIVLSGANATFGESVYVKYRGSVNLSPFACQNTPQSSVVKRICYDAKEGYVVVRLRDTYYHYCEVPRDVVKGWGNSASLGRYYNAKIKGRYDCRLLYMPAYGR
jgi:hypothetical protein